MNTVPNYCIECGRELAPDSLSGYCVYCGGNDPPDAPDDDEEGTAA
jgi:hypothetical protein